MLPPAGDDLSFQLMDVYIRPELGSVLLLDYHKYDEIRTLGFKQARHIMGRWVMENRRLVAHPMPNYSCS